MYIFTKQIRNGYAVLDTRDGTEEVLSYNEVCKILSKGIARISGLELIGSKTIKTRCYNLFVSVCNNYCVTYNVHQENVDKKYELTATVYEHGSGQKIAFFGRKFSEESDVTCMVRHVLLTGSSACVVKFSRNTANGVVDFVVVLKKVNGDYVCCGKTNWERPIVIEYDSKTQELIFN